jgi:hypothetical protein
MKGLRNVAHAAVLALWAVTGLLFTLKVVFGAGPFLPGLLTGVSWWLWFAGLAAVTTFLVTRWEKPLAALLVHSGAFVFLAMLPREFPLSVLRLGLDLLRSA